jgi:nitroreductase
MNATAIAFQDRPARFPTSQVGGAAVKPITQVLLDRRATQHFQTDPVPPDYLEAILRFGAQAPSGYNIQPWRFIVVRDAENRKRLQKAAMNQAKVAEAPVVIVAFAIKDEWKHYIDRVFEEGARRGMGKPEQMTEVKKAAAGFLDTIPSAVWLNRHTMIAVTTMMLVAEAYGLDTAPMEGFDPEAVKREFALPAEAEVIALLAIGKAKMPDKPYAGRLALGDFVFEERYGRPWPEGKGT